MREVIKKEVLKLLDAGIIYPVPHSEWVSPVQVMPKKGGMTVVENSKNELIPQWPVTGWRMCIDYQKLNGNKERSLPAAFHWWNIKAASEAFFLLFPWWVFRLPPNPHPPRRSEQEYVYMPLWNVCIPKDVIWALQCPCIVPKVHDVYLLRHDWRNHGSFHGRLSRLWKNFWSLTREFR